jgi:predicted SAM-dependent methyltransferase
VITLTEVIEHFNFNPVPTLKKIRKLLKPYGCLYICVPKAQSYTPYYKSWKKMPLFGSKKIINPDYYHNYMYNQDELKELFDLSGFLIKDFETEYNDGKLYYTLLPNCVGA